MTISTRDEGPVTIFSLQGKIMNETDSAEFMDMVKQMLFVSRNKIVLDFSGVDWINSTGLGALIAAHNLLREVNGQMGLASLNDSVQQVMALSRLNLVFDIHPTVAGAVESLN